MSIEDLPPQRQSRPGHTDEMDPHPEDEMEGYEGRGLLAGKKALVTGGDSGIGRAVSVAFAKEGADVAIAYLSEDDDARHTAQLIGREGRTAHLVRCDLSHEEECRRAVRETVERLGGLDLLVNNVAYQEPQQDFMAISPEQWEKTFRTNIHSYFWTTRAALEHMPDGSAIVNTSSINGLRGNKQLIDYSATKGAINAFTYALAQSLVERRIRVNCVAPGPVWTPLIPSTMDPQSVEGFGGHVPMDRPAHPDEIAPSYVFFAAPRLSSYISGEVLAPIGGETLPG